jgi:hypothetical protein
MRPEDDEPSEPNEEEPTPFETEEVEKDGGEDD